MRTRHNAPSSSRLAASMLAIGCATGACSSASKPTFGPLYGGAPLPDAATLNDGAPRASADAGTDGGVAAARTDGAASSAADDGSADVSADAPAADACTGRVAIVGGSVAGASTIAFAATSTQGSAWTVSSLAANVAGPPALVALGGSGGGFLAAFVDTNGELESATSTWTWSSPSLVGGDPAMGSPSLAVVGATVHLVYQGQDAKYRHGTYTSDAGWDSADDPVGGSSKQGFGPSAPVAAAVSGALRIAYGGQDGSLYDETWTAGAWQPDSQHASAQIGKLAPAIAAMSGGAIDTLVVYADPNGTLFATSRSAGAWSTPSSVGASVFTDAAPSLAPMSGGRAALAYLGTNGLPYLCVFNPEASPAWSAPAALGTGTTTLSSPPSVAPGVCGDDAIAALAEPSGIAAVRFVGGSFLPPVTLEGTAGMTFATVASQP